MDEANTDTADGVGPVSCAEGSGSNGPGGRSRPDSTPPTGDGAGRRSGGVPGESVREAFGPVVADRGAPWDRMRIRPVTTQGIITLGQLNGSELEQLTTRIEARRAPAPGPRPVADKALLGVHKFERVTSVRDCDGWVDLLAPMFATGNCCNLTGTYSDAYGYAHGLMLARNVIKDFRAFCRTLGHSADCACIGVERHPSGRDVLHFHAVIGGDWTKQEMRDAEALWISARGWAKAKPISDRAGAIEYAAKHLLKQRAEDHFDFWIPPRTFGSRVERRAYAHGMTLDEWHDRNTDSAR